MRKQTNILLFSLSDNFNILSDSSNGYVKVIVFVRISTAQRRFGGASKNNLMCFCFFSERKIHPAFGAMNLFAESLKNV